MNEPEHVLERFGNFRALVNRNDSLSALQEQLDPLSMRYSAARKQSAGRKFISVRTFTSGPHQFRQRHPGAVLARKSAQ